MSPVATLVERSTRYLMLATCRAGTTKPTLSPTRWPPRSPRCRNSWRRSLTWDLGHEMAQHQRFTIAHRRGGLLLRPQVPWQRGSNENTNGLLRQYLPRRVDFRTLTQDDLDAIAIELNERPRQTLRFKTPSQALAEVLR